LKRHGTGLSASKISKCFGEKAYLHALNSNTIERRDTTAYYKIGVKPALYKDNLSYLASVLKGENASAKRSVFPGKQFDRCEDTERRP
jgi:hypothetical protein